MLASARESIWVHFKNDMRPDRLRDERSHWETNKTQQNAIIQIRMEREYRGGGGKEKKRKEQFAVNFFGSKSQPNVPVNEWSNGESAERSFAVMAAWMGERELREIINCKKFSRCFPGITAFTNRHC